MKYRIPKGYYYCSSYQSIGNGARNQNYHVYCAIYDENGKEVDNTMKEPFFGKWNKCEKIIRKFESEARKAGYVPATVGVLIKIKGLDL